MSDTIPLALRVTTTLNEDRYLSVRHDQLIGESVIRITQTMIDLEDAALRERLIELGWTPPKN